MNVIYSVKLNVSEKNVLKPLIVKQKDSNSRYIDCAFFHGRFMLLVRSGSVAVNVTRADGQIKSFAGTINENGTVRIPVANWMTENAGLINCDVSVYDGDEKLTSATFEIEVDPSQNPSGTVSPDDPNVDLAEQMVLDAQAAADRAEAAAATAAANTAETMLNSIASIYSSNETYKVGEYVYNNGVLYRCTTAITTAESWTDTHWEKVQISSELVLIDDAIKRGYSLADDWERGGILTNGTLYNSTTSLRSSRFYYIGGKTITVSCNPLVVSNTLRLSIFKYNLDGTFVSTVSFFDSRYYPRSITLDAGYKYKFTWKDSTDATTYASDITVRIPNEIEYVPTLIQAEINHKAYDMTMADALIRAEKRNPFVLAPFEKGYVTFVWDDLNPDIDLVASIFAEYGFQIGIGAIPSKLSNIASGLQADSHGYTVGMTMQDVCEQVVSDGGEIMCHGSTIVTHDNQYDYDFMYDHYVVAREQLKAAGFDIRGFMRVGGGTVTHTKEIERWLIGNFEYSNDGIAVNYYQERVTIDNTLENLKASVLAAKTNHTWVKFMCHKLYASASSGITEANLRALLDYITEIGLDVVTYAYIFDNYSSSAFLQS